MSVYWYNFYDLQQIKDTAAYPGLETWLSIYKMCPNFLIDRAGRFVLPISTRLDPVAKLPDVAKPTPESFEACCLKRAVELFDLAAKYDKPIYLLFSGGLDSTVAAVSFLRACSLNELRDRLKIVTSTSAWMENPNFVRDHLIGNFEFISVRGFGHYFDGRAIIVNGDLSEFGAFNSQRLFSEAAQEKRDDAVFRYLINSGIEKKHAEKWTQIFKEDSERCPIELPTFLDWLWWIRFTWTWQYGFFNTLGIMTDLGGRIHTLKEHHERVHPFFDSEDFQLWMMKGNIDRSAGKKMHRAFIRDYTHDDEWSSKKKKFHSFTSVMAARRHVAAIDENFELSHDIQSVLDHYDPKNDFVV